MASSSNNSGASDSKDNRWYFTAEQLANSPSRRHGIDADQELSFRQLTAYLIQEMGQRLHVSQLCINTAIVYMHRFYAFHSFTHFHRNRIAAASLFLAAKVEEQPRKLEHVIKGSHMCLNPGKPLSPTEYNEQAQDLVFNENVLLQTLGFDVAIDHPHTHVVKTCHLVKACKDLAQTSYFLASNSLHLTSMCLQYRPTVVACFCIYLACKWSRWEIPQSTEGKHWFHYVDKTVTMDLLKQLTDEFIAIYEKSPARLKSKLNSIKALAQGARIPEPSRSISESSNGSQMPQIDPSARPESYSSHHRSHHSSSHPNHHHHSKQAPVSTEPGEHKPSSSHKQPYPPPPVSHSNRPRPERTQAPSETQFNIPAHGSNKTIVPIATSRSNASNRPQHGIPSSSGTGTSQRNLHTHDPNYHKNRNVIPPLNPPIPSHKMVPKATDPSRNLLKEPSARAIDPNKIAVKHPSSLYPSQNPSNNVGLDMTRNVLQSQQGVTPVQQQRTYIAPNTSQAPNYPQQIQNRNSSNIKYDQSVQQQTHLQNSQKQSIESSFNTTNTRQADDVTKPVDQMEICSPPKYSSHPQQTQHTQQSNVQMQTPSTQTKQLSIFSPEWNEKPPHANVSNISSNNNAANKAVGLNIKSNRDSPKKSDREKRSATPKKDKIRSELPIQDYPKIASNEKRSLPPGGIVKKPDIPIFSSQNSMPPMSFDIKNQQTHAINFSGVKRPPSTDMTIKIEEDAFRESKIRKVENQSPPRMVDQKSCPPFIYDQQLSNDSKSLKSFPSTVNGIETNPDLVSSLLKESLCNESKFGVTAFIKTEPKDIENFSVVDPGIVTETVPQQILQTDIPIKEECTSPSEELGKSKSEKKKKKDKHKHKEKDKSKDKEEKKKHKKDKDKHKEKERLSAGMETSEPVKIKISKDKLNLPILEPPNASTSGFKIKIPKDRIKGELSSFQVDDNASTVPIPPPSSLKIKISKDKIENYNHHSQDAALSALYSNSGGNIPSFHGHSSSSSSKKKDRDREREKEKKRSSNEYNRQNGSGGTTGLPGTSTKNQSNPNKMQQYNCNMSQLFGESNDDEDNLSPPQKNSHPFRYSDSNKYSQQQNNSGYYRNSSETVSVSIIQE